MRPYLRVANVFEDRIDLSDVMNMNFSPDEYEHYALKYGDILLNEGQSKHLVGRPAIYRDELPGACFTNSLVRFVCSDAVLPEYALAVFRHYLKSGRFEKIAKWTTSMAHLGAERFALLEFPVPPLAEQRRIVTKLEDLLLRARRARAALESISPLLERFRQALLSAAIRGGLSGKWRSTHESVEPASYIIRRIAQEKANCGIRSGRQAASITVGHTTDLPDFSYELPPTWKWVRADEICDFITKGTTPSKDKMESGSGQVPFVKVYNLTFSGSLDFSVNPTYVPTEVHEGELRRSQAYPGDVLMNIVGPPLGKVSIVPPTMTTCNVNQAIAIFRPLGGVLSDYLALVLLARETLDYAVRESKASVGQHNLTLEICRRLPIPLPPLAEQKEICRIVSDSTLQAGVAVSVCSDKLSELTESILSKAFRGELVPQDPSDEPASVLLERIRAEREASGGSGKKPRGRGRGKTS